MRLNGSPHTVNQAIAAYLCLISPFKPRSAFQTCGTAIRLRAWRGLQASLAAVQIGFSLKETMLLLHWTPVHLDLP